jgi:hypothetical protein
MELASHGSLLQAVVRNWVEHEYPGQPELAARAALVAAVAYEAGSSVSQSCEAAYALVRSWIDHPSHRGLRFATASPLAS